MAKKKSPSLSLYRNIAVSFSAFTFLLIVTILYFSIARATIVITPRVETFPLTTAVSVLREPVAGGSALPGKVFAGEQTEQGTFSASSLRTEDAKASGKVQIVNTTGNPQTLIATTRFLTPEKILFRLKDTVVVPSRGRIEGTIVADAPGASGEVAPTRFVIPGLNATLQEKIYGEATSPIAGGTRSIRRLTANDVDSARAELLKKMQDTVRSKEGTGEGAPADPLVLFSVEPTASALNQKLGAEVADFSLTITARVRGVVVSEKALHEWVSAQMKTTLPDDERMLPLPSDAILASVTNLDATAGTARLLVKAEGKALLREGSPSFDRSRFVGRTAKEVETLLASNGGVASVRVQLRPFFIKRFPRLPDHIRVLIKEP